MSNALMGRNYRSYGYACSALANTMLRHQYTTKNLLCRVLISNGQCFGKRQLPLIRLCMLWRTWLWQQGLLDQRLQLGESLQHVMPR